MSQRLFLFAWNRVNAGANSDKWRVEWWPALAYNLTTKLGFGFIRRNLLVDKFQKVLRNTRKLPIPFPDQRNRIG